MNQKRIALLSLIAAAATACSDAPTAIQLPAGDMSVALAKTPAPPPPPSILPTTPPAPGVVVRESFGMADGQRPHGGKGTMRDTFIHTSIGGFWLEYLGSKDTQWLAPNANQSWRFAGCSDDPWEMASPLQTMGNGCVVSEWFDPITSYPTALMPFTPPAAGYELSMDGYPAPIPNAYVAIGFTNSGALASNLTTSGSLWLRVRDLGQSSGPLNYELRTGGLGGAVLASGTLGYSGWNQMSIRYSPSTSTVTLGIAGVAIGSYSVSISPPRYVAFEGVGVLDNLVVRQ